MFDPNTGEEIKEESGMFSIGDRQFTAEDAKKKIENADGFINTLKSEKDELSTKYSNLEVKLQELQSRLDTSLKLEDALKLQTQEAPVVAQPTQTSQVVDEDAILTRLRASIAEESQQESQATNLKTSIEYANKRYGEKWQTMLSEQGQTLGMDNKAIEALARSNPLAFAKLFQLDTKTTETPSPSGGSFVGNPDQTPQAPKGVMFGSTTKDLINQWRYSGKQVGEANGFEYDPQIHQLKKQKLRNS